VRVGDDRLLWSIGDGWRPWIVGAGAVIEATGSPRTRCAMAAWWRRRGRGNVKGTRGRCWLRVAVERVQGHAGARGGEGCGVLGWRLGGLVAAGALRTTCDPRLSKCAVAVPVARAGGARGGRERVPRNGRRPRGRGGRKRASTSLVRFVRVSLVPGPQRSFATPPSRPRARPATRSRSRNRVCGAGWGEWDVRAPAVRADASAEPPRGQGWVGEEAGGWWRGAKRHRGSCVRGVSGRVGLGRGRRARMGEGGGRRGVGRVAEGGGMEGRGEARISTRGAGEVPAWTGWVLMRRWSVSGPGRMR
jgi:hypothetical protein